MTSRARFVLGAGIGIAISVPVFGGVENDFFKAVLMIAFGGIMGAAQVYAGKETASARKFTRLAVTGSILAMAIGIIIFLITN